ncbi:sulfatase-like hydrolase/transferase [Ancylobacter sp.]|uniref:sulfatase-like hydrolase/transferase n=1 Tax=Ancylobacter sp. TaxID=1872567 RepID=UPI003D1016D7
MVALIERRWTGRVRLAACLAALLFGAQLAIFLLLYVGGFYASRFVGRLITYDLVVLAIDEGFVRAAHWGGLAGQIGLVLLAAVVLAGTFTIGAVLAGSLAALFRALPSRRMVLLAGLPLLAYASSLLYVARVVALPQPYYSDPLAAALIATLVNTSGSDEANRADRAAYAALPAKGDGRNIIIIIADSLRADHLPLYGYPRLTTPFLARLEAQGHLHKVRSATSTCSDSICGILATLGSQLPAHAAPNYNFLLTDALRDRGYRTHFLLSGPHQRYLPLPSLYGPPGAYDTFIDGDRSGRGADDRLVIDALAALPRSQGEPNFFFIFLMSSHVAGASVGGDGPFQPALDQFTAERLVENENRHVLSPEVQLQNINRYDNGLVQADAFIEKTFSLLQEKGYLKKATVFILGDHSDALGERGLYLHNSYLYREFTNIPLLIYDTDEAAYHGLDFADQTDIAPTALERAGLPTPRNWRGQSLVSHPGRQVSFTQNSALIYQPCRGVYLRRQGTLNYLVQCQTPDGGVREEMFDLTRDELGRQPIDPQLNPARTHDMRRLLSEEFPDRKNHY